MSSKGEYAVPPPPRYGGGDRFYNPPTLRLQQQILLQQQQLVQMQLLQQQRQMQWWAMAGRAESSSGAAVTEAEKRRKGDDFDSSTLAIPDSVVNPALDLRATNLDRLMESVTPFIPAQFLSELDARVQRTGEVDIHPFFCLEDLWESFHEWSAYGAGVPLLLDGKEPIEQYYVPFLSGIQLYIDPSKPSSRVSEANEESDTESYRLTSSASNIDFNANQKAESITDSNMQRLDRLSLGDKPFISSFGSEADSANSPRVPSFQFLEYEQPHTRRPLTDKILLLKSEYPELCKIKSCDLLPTSWICVAWYPIYRIPIVPTLQDLDASFLTFHLLSTQSKNSSSPRFHAANTREVHGIIDPIPKISLPVFALASYKLKGSILSPCGPHECDQENSLLQAVENWLGKLQVNLPDYQFFRSHYSYWR